MKHFSRRQTILLTSFCLSVWLPFTVYGQATPMGIAPPAPTQLPTGGNVVAGAATITQSNATQNNATMDITQTTQRGVIDWKTFDVGSQAQVNFLQPASSSVTLNRVLGSDPSQLFGKITATGQIFLTNPNGVYFSSTSTVDVGGLVATTHQIGVDDFMSGKYAFNRNGATGSVVNEGTLRAGLGGYIALLAPEVRNEGVVIAQMGRVQLSSGEAITLNIDGSNSLAGVVVEPSTINALVENKGAVIAPGGVIVLSAKAMNVLQGGVVKNSGKLEATGLSMKGGRIVLEATDQVAVTAGSIDVSGSSGGDVFIGGGFQGKDTTITNAKQTSIAEDVNIKADATDIGDGGTVAVWSSEKTLFKGNISARGGSVAGDGGFVEVSGKNLAFNGLVDASAANGNAGTLLLDPLNIVVQSTGTALITDTDQFADPGADPSDTIIDPSAITAVTNAHTSVTLQANNDITINNAIITSASGTGGALTFQAGRSMAINAGIISDNGALSFTVNDSGAGGTRQAGGASFTNNSLVDAGSNNVSITMGTKSTSGTINTGHIAGHNLTITHNGPTVGVDAHDLDPIIPVGTGAIDLGQTDLTSDFTITTSLARNLTNTLGTIGTAGNVVVRGTATINVGAGDVTINGSHTDFNIIGLIAHNATLNDTNAVQFGTTNLSGNLTETTIGPMASTGSVQVAGTTTLTANNGPFGIADPYINLTNGSNHFTGNVTLSVPSTGATFTGGYAFIRDSGAITIASSNTQNDLQVYAGGNINVTSATSVGSGVLLSTSIGAVNTTTLNAGNWIQITTSSGTVNTGTTTAGSSLSVSATGAVDLGTTTVGTDLSVSTNGAVTDSGILTVPHQTTLTAGSGNNITFDSPNDDFSSIWIVSGKDVTLVDKNAINFGGYNGGGGYSSHIYGNLNLTAGNNISQTLYNNNDGYSQIRVDGTSTFTANNLSSQINLYLGANDSFTGDGNWIGQSNNFAGTVTLLAGNVNTGFSNVLLRNTNASAGVITGLTSVGTLNNVFLRYDNAPSVALPGMTAAALRLNAPSVANTAVTPSNKITQTGPIVVSGGTTIQAASTGDVVLTDALNNFNQFGVLNARDVNVNDTNAVVLYASPGYEQFIARNYTVTAGGNITDNGNNIWVQSGTLSLSTSGNITLGVSPALVLNTLVIPTANVVTIYPWQSVTLGNVTTTGALTLQSRNGGTLTQLASTAVSTPSNSATTFNTFNSGITLNQSGNVLGNIAIADAGTIILRENDAITQASAWTNWGTSGGNTTRYAVTLTTSDDQAITLDKSGSVFGDLTITQIHNVSSSPGNVYVKEDSDSIYGLTEGSAWTVHGTTKIDAGNYSINLNNGNNVLGPTQVIGGNGNTNSLPSTVTIYAKSNGSVDAITDVGGPGQWTAGTGTGASVKLVAYASNGTTAGGGNVNLTNASNVLGDLYVKATAATVTENDSITDGDSISWNGQGDKGWVTTGATNFIVANPSSKSITFDNLDNQLGPISINATGGTLTQVLITDNTDITQSAAWLVGAAPVTLDARHHAIDLSSYSNVLGDITINTTNGLPTSVAITEDDPITEGTEWVMAAVPVTLVAQNNKSIALNNALNVMGNLTITGGAVSITENDPITQSGAWTTTGTTTLNPTASAITLTNTGNVLGDIAIAGTPSAVSITENDNITQASAWVQAATPFTLNANGVTTHDIVLSQANNQLGDLKLTAQNATVVEADTAGITDSTAWTIPGTTTLTAGAANPIVLNANPASNFGTVSIVSASNADIADVNGIILGASTIASGGTLTVTAGGAITQSGAITSPYLQLIGTGSASLTNASNNVQNLAAGFSGGNLAFTNSGDFAVAAIGGTSGINIGAHNVTLTSVGGTITGLASVNASSSSLTVNTGTALELPQMSIAGAQSYTAIGGITLDASLTSTATGAIIFYSPVTLAADLTVQSNNSAITFASTLAGATNQLKVNAGNGAAEFDAAVTALGNTSDAAAALDLSSSGAIFFSTVDANNGLAITGPVVFKDTVTLADGAAASVFTGLVTLGKSGGMNLSGYNNMSFSGGVLLQNGAATINSNNSALTFSGGSTVKVSGPFALTLDSGTAALIGLDHMDTNLTSLTVTALNPAIPAGGVSIAGSQSYTATSGSSITLNGNVTSTLDGVITFNSPVIVGTSATVTTSNSNIIFGSTVDGNKDLTLSSGSGTKTFTGAIGAVTPLGDGNGAALILQGSGATTFSDTIHARSEMTAEGAVTFNKNVTLDDGDTGSTFTGLVTSGGTSGNTINGFDGLTFNGGLALVGGPVSVISNGSTIAFGNTVSGPQNLTLNALLSAAGTVTGLDQIGFTSDLTRLTITAQTLSLPSTGLAVNGQMAFTAAGGITLNGNVGNTTGITTGQIDFNSPVSLATGAIAIANSNATVNFASTLNGAQALSINNGSGTTTFTGVVGGSTPLSSLTTDATGTTAINGGAISTSGTQAYNDAVTLGAATTLTGVGVSFNSTLNGANTLTVNDSGTTTFAGIVGGSTPLTSLTTNAAGATAVNTTAITTSGAQTYNDAVTLGANATFTGAPITFNNTLNGAHTLTAAAASSTVSLNGVTGGVIPLTSVTLSGNSIAIDDVTTSGIQSYTAVIGTTMNGDLTTVNNNVTTTGPTTLGADVVINTDTGIGNITFSGATSTINGAHALTLTAGAGNVVLGGVVGGVTPLTAVTISGNDLTLPNITTVGGLNQSYTALDNITLNQSRVVNAPISFTADSDADGSGSFILLDGVSLTASNKALTITAADLDLQGSSTLSSGSGLMTIAASNNRNLALGGSDAIGQMTISGDELSRITTSGGLDLKTTGIGWIHVNGITSGQSQNITGVLSLKAQDTGDIGFITAPSTFNALTSNATGGTINIGVDLNTTNDPIIFATPVAIAGASTINSGGGNITFQNTLDVDNDLTLTTSNGLLTFNGAVGSNKTLVLNLGGGSVSGLGNLQSTLTGLTVNSLSGITLPAFTINGPQTYNTGVITATGNLGGIGLTFNNLVNVAPTGSALTFDAATGTLAFNDLVSMNAKDVTMTGDEINFTKAVTGSGNLVLKPATLTRNMAIGGSGAPIVGLNLTAGDISWLPIGTLASITFGNASGSGTLDVAGAINAPGTPLTFNGPGGISQSGGAVTSGALTLLSGAGIVLNNAANNLGAITINGLPTSINIADSTDITQGAAWAVGTAPVTLNAGASSKNITLTQAGNTFGTLTLTGTNVQVTEAASTDLGATTANTLTVRSTGDITSSGTVTVTGLADFKTLNDAGANIAIANSSTFGSVNAVSRNTADSTNASGNISLSLADSTLLKILATTGNITLTGTTGKTFSQDGTSTLGSSGLELLGAGATHDLTLGTNAITTLAGNTGIVKLIENSGFAIGTVNTVGLTTSGNTTLSSTGTVTQSQLLAASGLELLGIGGTYALTNTGNAITTLAGNTGVVSLINNGSFAIGTVNTAGLTTSGNTTLSSTGIVTQLQALSASGLELLGAGGSYILTNTGNAINTLAGNTGTVSFLENSGYDIGTVNTVGLTTSGNTTLSSTHTVTQSQAFHASGLELLGAGGTFTLTNTGNAITTLAGNTGSLSLVENSGFDIGTVNTVGLTASGNATVSSTGTVTQLQAITASGLELLGTGGSYTLTNIDNAITTLAGNTGSLRLVENSGFDIGTVNTVGLTTGGNTTLSSTHTVTQSQAFHASGLELLGAGGTFTLTNTGNAITTLAGNTGSLSLVENSGFDIGTVNTVGLTASGNTTVSSTGTVTQSQAITASGLELLGTGGSYALTNTSNAINTLAGNTGSLSLVENSGFDIGTVNTVGFSASGDTTLSSTGAVTQSRALHATGLELIGGGAFTLDDTGNAIATLAANTGSLRLTENSGFDIGTVNTVGLTTSSIVVLTSTGTVTQSQNISTAGLGLLGTGGTFNFSRDTNTIPLLAADTGNVTVHTGGAIDFGTVSPVGITATGDANIKAAGAISQSQPLVISGNLTLETTHVAGNVAVTNLIPLTTVIGQTSVGGNYTLTATGRNVSQYAGSDLQVRGNLNINAATLALGGAGNLIGGTTTTPSVAELRLSGVITLGDSVGTTINTPGNFSVISVASNKTFGGAVVPGSAITLNDSANSIGGYIAVKTAGPAVNSGVDVQTGIQQQSGVAIDVGGIASFTAENSTKPNSGFIHLNNAGNSFGSLVLSGTDVGVTEDTGATVINSANASTNLTLVSAGSVTQTGAIVTPALAVTSNGIVTLNNVGNNVTTLAINSAGNNISYADVDSFSLATVDGVTGINAGGTSVSLTAGSSGNITQSAAITNVSTLSLSAGGSIDLDQGGVSNTIGTLGNVIAGTGIEIADSTNGLLIDGNIQSTSGNISVVTTGGNLTLADMRAITAGGAGDIYLAAGLGYNFINNDSTPLSAALVLGAGRFIIYSKSNAGTVKGGLTGNEFMGENYAANDPSTQGGRFGNLFIYNDQATLLFTADNLSKIYGSNNPTLTYTVTGYLTGDNASTSFTGLPNLATLANSSSSVGNYTITIDNAGGTPLASGKGYLFSFANGTLTVDPYIVNITGGRVYDGTTSIASTNLALDPLVGSETLTLSGIGTLANKNVGNGKAVGVGTLTLNSGTGLASNYTLVGSTRTANITQAPLTLATSDVTKIYDGALTAIGIPVVTAGTLFTGDTISGGTYAFTDANAGSGNKTVTATAVTVSDTNGGGNYNVTYANNVTSTINPFVVSLTGSRAYDGTTNVSAGVLSTGALVGSETLGLSGVGTMADKHVGIGKTVAVGTLALTNGTGLASNYTLAGGTRTVNITTAPLTITTSNVTKTYDATLSASGTPIVGSGTLFGGDSLSGGTYGFTDPNVGSGNKTVNVSGVTVTDGNGGGDYNISYANNTTSTISPFVVNLTGSRIYDATTNVSAGALTIGTLVGSETLGLSGIGTMTDKHVGTGKSVAIGTLALSNGTGLASNYILAGGTRTVNITTAPLTITTSNVTKTYDATLAASGTPIVGGGTSLFGSDNLSGGTYAFTDPNVGSGNKAVTVTAVTVNDGNSGNNYAVTYANNTTSTINPYVVNLNGSRAYDGTTNVSSGVLTLGALVGGQTLTLSGSGTMADKHVGSGKSVSIGTLALGNGTGLASNYALVGGTRTVNITPATLVLASTDVTKTYNGTLTASGTPVAVSGSQLFSGDNLSGGSFAFTNANAGIGNKIVTTTGVTVNDGNGGGNYSLSYANNTTSTINPASITVTSSSVTKTYDGRLNANGSAILVSGTLYNNVSNGNAVDTLSGGTFNFTDANAGSGNKVITTSGVTLNDGNGGGNYNVAYINNTTSTINKAPLTLLPVANDKTYDGTNVATLSSLGFGGLIGTETLNTSMIATFSNKNADTGKVVSISGITLQDGSNGGLASNYTSPSTASTTASILPKPITFTATVADKVYDGGVAATLSGYNLFGMVGSETLTAVTGGSATFADKNVGNGKTVTVTGISLLNGSNGGLASNYLASGAGTGTASITPANLFVAGVVANDKVYDGTAAAVVNTRAAILTGVIGSDNVSVGNITGTFASKNVGSNLAVTGSGFVLAGSDAVNYNLIQPTGLVANITPRDLTVTAVGVDKVYDGTVSATVALADNRIAGDVLTIDYNSSFMDKNASIGKYVGVNGITLNGANAANYAVNSSVSTFATISPRPLIVAATGVDKTYDTTAKAAVTLSDNRLTGDTLSLFYDAANFDSIDAGVGKRVTVSGIGVAGSDANNYLANTMAQTTASIAPSAAQLLPTNLVGSTVSSLKFDSNVGSNESSFDSTMLGATTASTSSTNIIGGASGSNAESPSLGTLIGSVPGTGLRSSGSGASTRMMIIGGANAGLAAGSNSVVEKKNVGIPNRSSGNGVGNDGFGAALGDESVVKVSLVRLPSSISSGLIEVTVPQNDALFARGFLIPLPGLVADVASADVLEATTSSGAQLPAWIGYINSAKSFMVSSANANALPFQISVKLGSQFWTIKILKRDH